MADWMPFISQGKFTLQMLTGDFDGAARTSENFLRECPGIAQGTALVQMACGDRDGSLETQKRSLNTVSNIANAIPPIGYPKAAIHHLCGDKEGRNRALNSATRSTAAIAFTTATGGGAAAVIASNVAYDAARTAITRRDQGMFDNFRTALDKPSAGSIYDAAYSFGGPAIDPVVFRPCRERGGTRVRDHYYD